MDCKLVKMKVSEVLDWYYCVQPLDHSNPIVAMKCSDVIMSMSSLGQLTPISVVQGNNSNGSYRHVFDGNIRLYAARMLGQSHIMTLDYGKLSEKEVLIRQLVNAMNDKTVEERWIKEAFYRICWDSRTLVFGELIALTGLTGHVINDRFMELDRMHDEIEALWMGGRINWAMAHIAIRVPRSRQMDYAVRMVDCKDSLTMTDELYRRIGKDIKENS